MRLGLSSFLRAALGRRPPPPATHTSPNAASRHSHRMEAYQCPTARIPSRRPRVVGSGGELLVHSPTRRQLYSAGGDPLLAGHPPQAISTDAYRWNCLFWQLPPGWTPWRESATSRNLSIDFSRPACGREVLRHSIGITNLLGGSMLLPPSNGPPESRPKWPDSGFRFLRA